MKKIIGLLGLVCGCVAAFAQRDSRLVFSPERPVSGSKVTMVYYPDSGKVTTDTLLAVAYIYDSLYQWRVTDIRLQSSGDTAWICQFAIPADAGFMAFAFYPGGVKDNNNDRGYPCLLYSANGDFAAGSRAGYALLRSPSYNMGVPEYFENYTISDTATYFWISNEIAYHPAIARKKLIIPYVQSSYKMGGSMLGNVTKAIAYLRNLPNPSETELVKWYWIAHSLLKDSLMTDTVTRKWQAQYADGQWAKWKAYTALNAAREPDVQLALSKQFIHSYPVSKASSEMDRLLNIDYDKVYRLLFMITAAKIDSVSAVIQQYVPDAPYGRLIDMYYKSIQIPYDYKKNKTAAELYADAVMIMNRAQWLKNHQPAEYWYYSHRQWVSHCNEQFKTAYVTHTGILMETGHDKEALAVANEAQRLYQYANSTLNERQALLLQRAGNKTQLQLVLENSIRGNQASAAVVALIKKEYLQKHPRAGVAEVDKYMESLKDEHTMELMREEVKQDAIRVPAPDFVLEERERGTVRLSELKGKIVVLDLWATWCAPCKAGMAGMKMAVDKYSKDKDVVFFFVDTQEHAEGYKEKVTAFLKQMHYDNFRVLFDTKDEVYNNFSKLVHASGIPFKIVINKKGEINFANIGYKGSPSGLADEISTMIELAR